MRQAADIHGVVFKHGSVTLLARIVGADGTAVVKADLSAARYSVYVIDPEDPDADAPVAGHQDVDLEIAELIFDSLQLDDLWDADAVGYNFRHVLDVSVQEAFTIAGRSYRIVFELTPATGQVILVRFRVSAI